jgi:hypothetical protein
MKLITFSLWGADPKYLRGALKNAELANTIYSGWMCRFYVGRSVPFPIIHELKSFENVEVVEKDEWGDWTSMYWRFEPASEDGIEVMISRDTDSRLGYREKNAVDEWISSDKGFHIMRDHPFHKFPVLGGMWGVKAGILPNMTRMINQFAQQDKYGTDYEFFQEAVLPNLKQSQVMVHDEFFGSVGRNFPTKREGLEFVGKVYDENDNTVDVHENALSGYLKDNKNDIYIYHHLGLGDHLDCNAMPRIYLNEYGYSKVYVFAKNCYADMIEFMFRDEKNIEVIRIPGIAEESEVKNELACRGARRLVKVGHDSYPWGQEEALNMGCAEIFYELAGIEYKHRFDNFYFERDRSEEDRVYKKLNPNDEKYIFVHDDPKRGFQIPEEEIKKIAGGRQVLRNDMSENMFYFCKILEEADQIHCMESCFRSLVEVLDVRGDLYFHNFRKEAASGFLGNSTRQPWKEIKW